jgi:hypothetical protein
LRLKIFILLRSFDYHSKIKKKLIIEGHIDKSIAFCGDYPMDFASRVFEIFSIFSRLSIRQVRVRYQGRESASTFYDINYISEKNGFIKNEQLSQLFLDENEIVRISEELLDGRKPDWYLDWGGRGVIIWDATKAQILIEHEDRFMEEIQAKDVIDPSEIIQKKNLETAQTYILAGIDMLSAKFCCSTKGCIISNLTAGLDSEILLLRQFKEEIRVIMMTCVTEMIKEIEVKSKYRVAKGSVYWPVGSKLEVQLNLTRETYSKINYSLHI